MTQNKFWLVLNEKRELSTNKHITKSDAIMEANELAFKNPQHTYFVMATVCIIKANVSVIETDLIADEVESTPSLTEKLIPEFKVDDLIWWRGDIYTICSMDGDRLHIMNAKDDNDYHYNIDKKTVYKAGDVNTRHSFIDMCSSNRLAYLAEPTPTEPLTPKFKVGDFVEYHKCKYEIHEIALRDDDSYPCNFKGVGYKCKNSDTGAYGWIPESVLSLWEDESPNHGFKVGDKVKVNDNINLHLKHNFNIGDRVNVDSNYSLYIRDNANRLIEYCPDSWTIEGFDGDTCAVLRSCDPLYYASVHISALTLAE